MTTPDSASVQPDLITHLESRLGRLAYGWTRTPSGESTPFQVARFEGGVFSDTLGFATVGVSAFALESPNSHRLIRQELLVVVTEQFGERNIPAMLQQVAFGILEAARPLLRGDVIELPGIAVSGTNMTALYATRPVYFDDAFATLSSVDYGVVLVWLVPIHESESSLVKTDGWPALEAAFAKHDAVLFDPARDAVV